MLLTGEYIDWKVAKESGVYRYTTVVGGTSTIRKFVYGRICGAPAPPQPSPEELQARKAAEAKKKAESQARSIRYYRECAAAGDSFGELRLGECYRDGEGVPKDLAKAREWLSKAAAHGDKEAAKELQNLP